MKMRKNKTKFWNNSKKS